MNVKTLVALLLSNIVYIFIGGLIFRELEHPTEKSNNHHARLTRDHFLRNFTCMSEQELTQFIRYVVAAYDNGLMMGSNESESDNWDLKNSVFFSFTIVTTIGYGNLSPTTKDGKIFTIFYAIIGIPLCLSLLAGIGEKIYRGNRNIAERVNCFTNPQLDKIADSLLMVTLGLVVIVLIPSAIFHYVEDWDYLTSVYYSVVTLCTIGFGDYVVGSTSGSMRRGWYRMVVIVWIAVGLAWVAGCINVIQGAMNTFFAKEMNDSDSKSDASSESGKQRAIDQHHSDANGSSSPKERTKLPVVDYKNVDKKKLHNAPSESLHANNAAGHVDIYTATKL